MSSQKVGDEVDKLGGPARGIWQCLDCGARLSTASHESLLNILAAHACKWTAAEQERLRRALDGSDKY